MKITVLDAKTLGNDLDLSPLDSLGEVCVWDNTSVTEVASRIRDCDVIVINKVKLNGDNLSAAGSLKLICIAATGYDNIDTAYCASHGIAVCNVAGYSTDSVAQLTVAMALSLYCHLPEYTGYVRDGSYSQSGSANRLEPVYHEISGATLGIVGYGNIGKRVGIIAGALGCRVVYNKRSPDNDPQCLGINELCRVSDIISIHVPLTPSTKGMIGSEQISMMKKSCVIINAARGAVWDENAIADALVRGKIGGIGSDVYSCEPFGNNHPFRELGKYSNACLTPHMAWGSYEARVRCLNEIIFNIRAFYAGEKRSRIV